MFLFKIRDFHQYFYLQQVVEMLKTTEMQYQFWVCFMSKTSKTHKTYNMQSLSLDKKMLSPDI